MPLLSTKLRYLLFPLALFYWGMIFWRNLFYTVGFFVTRRLPVTVISVGNLSVGGTGKTPAVIYLAEKLLERGLKVAIVSRGYGRETTGTLVVCDGKTVLASSKEAGDEPYFMARRLPGVMVVVDEVRYRGGMMAMETFKPDVILLDDGFQHRALERDIDIVLLNSQDPPKAYKLLPYGKLREPWFHLRRADIVFWTKSNLSPGTEEGVPHPTIRGRAMRAGVPVFTSDIEPDNSLQDLRSGELPLNLLKEKRIFAFCGIADPGSFHELILQTGAEIVGFEVFDDHHVYTREEVEWLIKRGETAAAQILVTTEKDIFKVERWVLPGTPLYCLEIHFVPSAKGEATLWRLVEEALHRRR
ncbi:MAG: tetraacyldisaccharide 4'-kinase [Fidelibacterota bacterium]